MRAIDRLSGCVGVRNHEPAGLLLGVEDGGRLGELRPQPAARRDQALVLDQSAPLNLARLGLRLGHYELGFAPRVISQLLGRLLRGDESGPEDVLELPETGDLALEVLDLVREVGALAPDVL